MHSLFPSSEAFQISAKHFVAGLIVKDGIVIEAAPIISYMRKWKQSAVFDYCAKKGWKIVSCGMLH